MGHMKFRPVEHCAFCPKPADSREHAWPEWLIKKLAKNPQQLLGHIDGRDPSFDRLQKAIKIPCVCIECNTLWLNKTFENVARPLMEPLIDDQPTKLDIPQQAFIAAWAAKTAMVFEFVSSDKPLYYTDEERFRFRSMVSPVPPSFSAVWLGRFQQSPDIKINFVTVGTDGSGIHTAPSTATIHAYTTTMAFGNLVIQIVTVRTYERKPFEAAIHPKKRGWNGNALVRIWPAHNIVRWPPATSFGFDTPSLGDLHLQFDNPSVELGGQFSDDVIWVRP
jgi:hypothetical protein